MNDFFKAVDYLTSLEEANRFAQEKLQECMALFLKATPEQRTKCEQKVRALKSRLHPLQMSLKAQDLLRQHAAANSDEDRQRLQAKYIKLSHALLESEQGILYSKVMGIFDRQLAPILAMDHGAGRSNRARRAKVANSVFTQNAGLSSGASQEANYQTTHQTDRYGNMIGSEWDLGCDGAYDGLKVVMVHECNEFTGELPIKALRDKGFEVVHKFVRVKSELPSVSELSDELENASQIWLIAGSFAILTDEHLDIIVNHWQQGLGVYIFGDNKPYYVDANRLLSKMSPMLAETASCGAASRANFLQHDGFSFSFTRLQLDGNTPGRETVRARRTDDDIGPGFVPNHLLVTGIVSLFEGITVASINKNAALELGFEEVLREHTGQLVVIAREAMNGYGPVIVDGAFTKLYCHWDEGGSSRFVRNCACWLSTIMDGETAAQAEITANEPVKPPELSLDGAFICECSITHESGPAALLASELADMEQNTTDFSLDNNLALARWNMVLGSQPLTIDVAKLFLQQGQNPFTRSPVAAILPIVALSNSDNLALVSEIANKLFMGGRAMNRHSLNILLSVCEEMLYRQPDNPQALEFFIKQILRNAVSTPDMLKGIPGGPTVPLEQGLRNNITVTGEFVPLRKAFPHVARIVRLLANYASEPRLPSGTLCQVARRSLLKTVVGAVGRFAKLEPSDGVLGDNLIQELDQLIFDSQLGIPIGGSAKVVELSELKNIVSKALQQTTVDDIVEDAERVAIILGKNNSIVSPSELTVALLLMRARAGTLWKVLIEPLLAELKLDPLFSEIWEEEIASTAVNPAIAIKLANDQLTGSFQIEPAEHARAPWPGFASPFGPSVYRCKCGFVFGDPEAELTEFSVQKLKSTRNKHFQEMFGADGNGYPTKTSAHFPLHRAVQRVLTSKSFRNATERSDAMELAVAKYLQRKHRGDIHVSTIRSDIQFAIDTYLECRGKGMNEPKPDEPIDFLKKANIERELILKSRAAGNGKWVDRQRPVSCV